MAQYRETIGQLEPSYVIRKFLDAQRIHNLTEYLEDLHGQAGPCSAPALPDARLARPRWSGPSASGPWSPAPCTMTHLQACPA